MSAKLISWKLQLTHVGYAFILKLHEDKVKLNFSIYDVASLRNVEFFPGFIVIFSSRLHKELIWKLSA